jgi:predicted nucleic acid-binding protein
MDHRVSGNGFIDFDFLISAIAILSSLKILNQLERIGELGKEISMM